MPSVLIEVRRAYDAAEATVLLDAVHAALREAFKIPEHDRTGRLIVHEPHLFATRPLAQPECFTAIRIDAFAGRSVAAKRQLYQAIVRNLAALGIPADHTLIVLNEIPLENWGIRGGRAACDVELGFAVNV